MRCLFVAVLLPIVALLGCESTPAQQQVNLDTKAIAAEVAAAIKVDPTIDPKVKNQAQVIADAVVKAIDAKGNITPESVGTAVLQSGAVPDKYIGYGALGLLALRIVQAQVNNKKKTSP